MMKLAMNYKRGPAAKQQRSLRKKKKRLNMRNRYAEKRLRTDTNENEVDMCSTASSDLGLRMPHKFASTRGEVEGKLLTNVRAWFRHVRT